MGSHILGGLYRHERAFAREGGKGEYDPPPPPFATPPLRDDDVVVVVSVVVVTALADDVYYDPIPDASNTGRDRCGAVVPRNKNYANPRSTIPMRPSQILPRGGILLDEMGILMLRRGVGDPGRDYGGGIETERELVRETKGWNLCCIYIYEHQSMWITGGE